jgi:hypothetical protein
LFPDVIWEALDDDNAETHAEITLELLREALTR